MKANKGKQVFYWLPRVLAIMLIAFFSVFALDVFGEPNWFLGLIMHLVPSFILIILTVIAWRREWVGGWLFVVTSLVITVFFHSVTMAIPALVVGILFLMNDRRLKK